MSRWIALLRGALGPYIEAISGSWGCGFDGLRPVRWPPVTRNRLYADLHGSGIGRGRDGCGMSGSDGGKLEILPIYYGVKPLYVPASDGRTRVGLRRFAAAPMPDH